MSAVHGYRRGVAEFFPIGTTPSSAGVSERNLEQAFRQCGEFTEAASCTPVHKVLLARNIFIG